MKEFLSRGGHPFVERTVDEDPAAYDALLKLGFRSVPVTAINGTFIKGYKPDELAKALAGGG